MKKKLLSLILFTSLYSTFTTPVLAKENNIITPNTITTTVETSKRKFTSKN